MRLRRTYANRLKFVFFLLLAVLVSGLMLSSLIHEAGGDRSDRNSVSPFFYLYTHTEPLHFVLMAFAVLYSPFVLQRTKSAPGLALPRLAKYSTRSIILAASVGVLVTTSLGTFAVIRQYPLAVDEFVATFQAKIFARGQIRAHVDPLWQEFALPMTSNLVLWDPKSNTWISGYLPVYSAFRALFELTHAPWLTNPLFGMLSVLALAGIAANVWPGEKYHELLASLMLVTSPQFLINSMTYYAYPAHLCLNLTWLWLYTLRKKRGLAVAPWLGVITMGLHQPVVHALFVAPFILRILFNESWRVKIYTFGVYAAGCGAWAYWLFGVRTGFDPGSVDGVGASVFVSYFSWPDELAVIRQAMNFSMLASWQSVALVMLASVAFCGWKDLTPFLRDLALSCLLTFLFFVFYNVDQGQGFGYRYTYGILGSLALLAVAGWDQLKWSVQASDLLRFVALSSCLALLVQFPIRCIQTERFISPFADSMAHIRALKEPFVLVDPWAVWYAKDLVRNDPFVRNSPKILFANRVPPELLRKLEVLGPVHRIQPEELIQFGMHRIKDPVPVTYR